MSTPETGTEVLLVDVGDLRLAIPVGAVIGVDLEDPVPEFDIHQALSRDASGDPRRIRVRGRAPFDLTVHSSLRVERIDAAAMHPLPTFLSGMHARLGLAGLIRLDGRFVLFIDPTALEPAA